jgi:hypothetical protein
MEPGLGGANGLRTRALQISVEVSNLLDGRHTRTRTLDSTIKSHLLQAENALVFSNCTPSGAHGIKGCRATRSRA